jgi:hypothetical protein
MSGPSRRSQYRTKGSSLKRTLIGSYAQLACLAGENNACVCAAYQESDDLYPRHRLGSVNSHDTFSVVYEFRSGPCRQTCLDFDYGRVSMRDVQMPAPEVAAEEDGQTLH